MKGKENARKSARNSAAGGKASRFTDEERAAMRERARELKAETRRGAGSADGERDALAKIAELPEPDRSMAKRLHES